MADEDKKVEEAQEPTADQVELVGEAKKAEAEAIEALPKVEKAEAPKPDKVAEKPSKKPADYTPRLRRDYDERIVPAMTERFGYKNRMEVPKLDKIIINMGVGEATQDKKRVETA
ncbi:MAG: 50S ribosomal protein L5, partial [Sphingomicrobium sp.]